MSEPIPQYILLWWMAFALSVGLLLYEMIYWFRSRTVKLGEWVDSPRIQPPGEEIEGLTEWIGSFRKDETGPLEFKKRILNDVTETVTLALGLDEDVLKKLMLDDSFVKKNFGSYDSITTYLSRGQTLQLSVPIVARTEQDTRTDVNALIHDTMMLLDEVNRWEKKYESPGSQ